MQVNTSIYGQGINYSGKTFIKCADFNIPGATTDSSLATIEKAVDTEIIAAKGELDKSIIMGEIGGGDLCNIKLMRYVNGQIKYQNIKFDSLPFLMLGGYNYLSDAFYSSGFNYVYDNNNLEYVSADTTYVPITFGQYPGNKNCNSAELQNSFITDFDYSKLVLSPFYRVISDSYNGRYDDKGITELNFPFAVKYVHAGLFYIDAQNRLQYIGSEYEGWNLISLAVDQTINADSLNFDSSQIRMINLSSSRRYRDNPYASNAGGYYEYCTLWGCSNNSIGTEHPLFSNGKFTDGACICFGNDVNFHVDGASLINDGITIHNSQELQAFRERIYKNLAYTGLQFVRNQYASQNREIDRMSNNFCIPIWEKGVTTGNYTYGIQNAENDAYNWSNIRDNNYVPRREEKDIGDFRSRFGGADVEGAAAYGLSKRDMIAFINWINSVNTEGVQQDFKGKNPVDYIITCMYSPYQLFPSSASHNLTIAGNSALYPSSDPLTPGAVISAGQTRDMFVKEKVASFDISRNYNDFRDFAPYTTIELSIPFCDTVQLDPAIFYNHKLNVTMSFDTRTGNCMAHICRDDYEIQTISGTFAVPVTFSAIAQGSYQNSMKQNQVNFANSVINTLNNTTGAAVNAAMSVNAAGAVASGMNLAATIATGVNDIEYNMYKLTHTAPNVSRVGNIGDLNNFSGEIRVKLLIKHFKALDFDADSYQNTVGYACSKAGKISSFSGYIKCSNVKLADNNVLTANEKTELKNLLCKGVII